MNRRRQLGWVGFGVGVGAAASMMVACVNAVESESDDAAQVRKDLVVTVPNTEKFIPEEACTNGVCQGYEPLKQAIRDVQDERLKQEKKDITAKLDPGEAKLKYERGFHAKSHLCAAGTFSVDPDSAGRAAVLKRTQELVQKYVTTEADEVAKLLKTERDATRQKELTALATQLAAQQKVGTGTEADLRYGAFAAPNQTFPAYVRFSNGTAFKHGIKSLDKTPDVRGLAIKVIGVDGPKILGSIPGEQEQRNAVTQDFLMTNAPASFANTAFDFMKFGRAHVNVLDGALWGLKNLGNSFRLVTSVAKPIKNMDTQRYWGGVPYMLGGRAVKYLVRPCSDSAEWNQPETDVSRIDPDYLRKRLASRVAANGVCYDFYLQFQTNPRKQPVEASATAWEECTDADLGPTGRAEHFECAPVVKVARMEIPKGPANAVQQEYCDRLSFTPWHTLAPKAGENYGPFQPVGNMNRARRHVLLASATQRKFVSEPTKILTDEEAKAAVEANAARE